jgi:hypothetical protein
MRKWACSRTLHKLFRIVLPKSITLCLVPTEIPKIKRTHHKRSYHKRTHHKRSHHWRSQSQHGLLLKRRGSTTIALRRVTAQALETLLRRKFRRVHRTVFSKTQKILQSLKVDSNEKWGGSERWQWLGISLGPWRSMAICHLNIQFLCKKPISFSASTSIINRRFHDE